MHRHRARFAPSFWGLRVLPGGPGSTRERPAAEHPCYHTRGPSRDAERRRGKLTTYRRIAPTHSSSSACATSTACPRPLPGATGLDRGSRGPWELDPATRGHLLHLYGSLAPEVLAPALDDPSLLELLVPGRPDLRAQELYAREHEWALTDEDVMRRRTTVWLRPV